MLNKYKKDEQMETANKPRTIKNYSLKDTTLRFKLMDESGDNFKLMLETHGLEVPVEISRKDFMRLLANGFFDKGQSALYQKAGNFID
jgi:hypothetical protein